jgi:ADP-ribosylglycohydrolase
VIGAITGDVIGSVYEGAGTKTTGFRLFNDRARPTDDSVLTLAVARAILDSGGAPTVADFAAHLREVGRRYPLAGYGGTFVRWLADDNMGAYGSWGNGSAMRSSPVGWAYDTVAHVLRYAELCALPTHDHPEGIKGAQAVALAVLLARQGASKADLRNEISRQFSYDLDRTVQEIRRTYTFEISCQRSVPESIIAFLDSTDFESAIRNAISLGGDADTQACIAGAVAEAFYGGVPPTLLAWALQRLDGKQLHIVRRFTRRYLEGCGVAEAVEQLSAVRLESGDDEEQ